MRDNVQIKLRQRADLMLKVCELAESHRPETDKATCSDLSRHSEGAHPAGLVGPTYVVRQRRASGPPNKRFSADRLGLAGSRRQVDPSANLIGAAFRFAFVCERHQILTAFHFGSRLACGPE